MYTSLHIKGFRCFRDLKIDKLARINLIGGKNNTGKTALLEAVALRAVGAVDLGTIPGIYQLRELPFEKFGAHLGFRDLFLDGSATPSMEIHASSEDESGGTLTVAGARSRELAVPVGNEHATGQPAGSHSARQMGMLNLALKLRPTEGEAIEAKLEWGVGKLHGETTAVGPPARRVHFVATKRVSSPWDVAELFGRLQVERREGPVIEALRQVEPSLAGLEVVVHGESAVFYADLGQPPLRPLGLAGEGMSRLRDVMVGLCDIRPGLLLIDEFENGLH